MAKIETAYVTPPDERPRFMAAANRYINNELEGDENVYARQYLIRMTIPLTDYPEPEDWYVTKAAATRIRKKLNDIRSAVYGDYNDVTHWGMGHFGVPRQFKTDGNNATFKIPVKNVSADEIYAHYAKSGLKPLGQKVVSKGTYLFYRGSIKNETAFVTVLVPQGGSNVEVEIRKARIG